MSARHAMVSLEGLPCKLIGFGIDKPNTQHITQTKS